MHLTNLAQTLTTALALLQSTVHAAPAYPINAPQTRQTTQRLTLLLAPSLPSYPMPAPSAPNATVPSIPPANTTLLVSTRVTPTGTYPFKNSTFDPAAPDPTTPVPFTWMKVQVSRQDRPGVVVVDWTKVPVDVEDWGMWFDVAKLEGDGEGRVGGAEERTVPLSVVGVSPDGLQSFFGSGEVVVVEE